MKLSGCAALVWAISFAELFARIYSAAGFLGSLIRARLFGGGFSRWRDLAILLLLHAHASGKGFVLAIGSFGPGPLLIG